MPQETKASLAATGAGCFVTLLGGICGVALGYALMPAIADGGDFGALADIILSLLLWCGCGFALGLIGGALLAGRVARWVEARKK